MGFLMNPGYVALNAMGIEGHGNCCRNDKKVTAFIRTWALV